MQNSKIRNFKSNLIKEKLHDEYSCLDKYLYKVISLEDWEYSLKELFKMYIIGKIINIINEKFLLLIITNIVILYSPIENITDHFLFKAKMAVKQTIEGILGILSCLIPRYEEPKKEK